jgi:hypothetical protein
VQTPGADPYLQFVFPFFFGWAEVLEVVAVLAVQPANRAGNRLGFKRLRVDWERMIAELGKETACVRGQSGLLLTSIANYDPIMRNK